MADDHDKQHRNFHWPPTAEELESIQVFDMSGDQPTQDLIRASTTELRRVPPTPAPLSPSTWRRLIEHSAVTHVGLAAASLAAVGIAITSMLAPRQLPHAPLSHASRTEAHAAVIRPAADSPLSTPSTVTVTAEKSAFRPMVTLELEAPSEPRQVQAQPRSQAQPQRPFVVDPRAIGKRSTSPHTRAVRRGDAGPDPVSRFAVRTGVTVWKALRAVGRSFKRDQTELLLAPRRRST